MLSIFRNKGKQILLWAFIIILGYNSYSFSRASELPDKPDNTEITENTNDNGEAQPQEKIEPKSFSGGKGTAKKPYLISSKKDLLELADELSKKDNPYRSYHYKLTKDINLGLTEWSPMCHSLATFCGVFDGNGHRITIKKIASGSNVGFFSGIDSTGTVKNLIIKSSIDTKLSPKSGLNFGLIAGFSEGTVKNCTTEGTIKLTVSAKQDINIGAVMGKLSGSARDIQNNASISVSKNGAVYLLCGGIAGSGMGSKAVLTNISNHGNVIVKAEGSSKVGGIIGQYFDGKKLYNVLNNGNISLSSSKLVDNQSAVGGIAGDINNSTIDRAINQKKIYIEYTSKPDGEEVIAGGIVGTSRNSKYTNVGNEGSIECYSRRVGIAAGIIGAADAKDKIYNAYNVGAVYTHTDYTNNSKNRDYYDVYSHGFFGGDLAEVKNCYNSGKITLRQGKRETEYGEAFANIRPGENTKSFHYSYWSSDIKPFPPLQKGTDTTASFSTASGKLSKNISIGSKKYSNITDALNAWIDNQKDKKNYVKWKGKGTPGFTEVFGYTAP